jgi:hypothetical protein
MLKSKALKYYFFVRLQYSNMLLAKLKRKDKKGENGFLFKFYGYPNFFLRIGIVIFVIGSQ